MIYDMTTSRDSGDGSSTVGAREAQVLDALRGVIDPCCEEKEISIVDMGLVSRVDAADAEEVKVDLILTSGWCPFAVDLITNVRDAAQSVPGVSSADVQLTWDEAWGTHRLSSEAKVKLRFLPDPRQVASRDAYLAETLPSRRPLGA